MLFAKVALTIVLMGALHCSASKQKRQHLVNGTALVAKLETATHSRPTDAVTTVTSLTTTTNTFRQQRARDEAMVGGIIAGAVGVVGAGIVGGVLGAMTTTVGPDIISQTFVSVATISPHPAVLGALTRVAGSSTETTTIEVVRGMKDGHSAKSGHGSMLLSGWFIMPILAVIACLFLMKRPKPCSKVLMLERNDEYYNDEELQSSESSSDEVGAPMYKLSDSSSDEVGSPKSKSPVKNSQPKVDERCEEIVLSFQPGKLGMEALGNKVDVVHDGGQAQKLGVQPGWTMTKVNDSAFSRDILYVAIDSGLPFTVAFNDSQVYWE